MTSSRAHPETFSRNLFRNIILALRAERLGIGWEDASLRELVANWHRLTASVRAEIMELVRSSQN